MTVSLNFFSDILTDLTSVLSCLETICAQSNVTDKNEGWYGMGKICICFNIDVYYINVQLN